MAHDVVIGIDLGTTATKVVAYQADGAAVAEASNGYPLEEPSPGRAEQDPRLILDAIYRGLRDVVAEIGADRVRGRASRARCTASWLSTPTKSR